MIGVGGFEADENARRYVGDVMDSGRLSYGPYCRRFEREFSAIHGCEYGVLSNSGTSSLHVALQALKIMEGWEDGEVLVPATTFVATANVAIHNGLRPRFVDVEPLYYGMDIGELKRAIGPKTRAIIPVHLFGQPCEIDAIMDLANEHGLKVIEDSCETMFATYQSRPVGSWGHVACFSTYMAHIITTGVGGIATTNEPALADLMRSLVNHGRDTSRIAMDDNGPIEKRFTFNYAGHSFRITELEGAIACAQLEDYSSIIGRRKEHAERLTKMLQGYPLHLPRVRPNSTHSWMMYPIMVHGDKWPLVRHLESRGIETRDMLPLVNQPIYQEYIDGPYPVSDNIIMRGFYVGCHPYMTEDDFARIDLAFREYYRGLQSE